MGGVQRTNRCEYIDEATRQRPPVIVYLDASTLVKRYVAEAGSAEFEALNGAARAVHVHAA